MNSIFFNQDIFASSYDQCQGLLSSADPSLLDLPLMNKLDFQFYPTPNEPPSNQFLLQQDDIFKSNYESKDLLNDMMMVPPLYSLEPAFEHTAIDIDMVDKFIAEHEAALNSTESTCLPVTEASWSHWTFPRATSPEMDGLSSSKSTTDSSQILASPVPEKSVIKVVGRRGRGKGVKNKVKKAKVDEPKPKKPVLEGTLYVCQHDQCGKSFTRPYNLTSHMRTHSTERPYACSHCDRKFARQHDRNRHEKLHWGIRPYACHHCHKSFARMDALNRHLRMENGCTGIHL